METHEEFVAIFDDPKLARFPLGSGINGNEMGGQSFHIRIEPASLWEVELMETEYSHYGL
ncbi:hypothetical protein CRC_02658 [Cylindrospermopsis raciborskii CS-505]|nr:hypothetical protein CRC_02658 [Cylindrospermopsis raciborskii CS-505]